MKRNAAKSFSLSLAIMLLGASAASAGVTVVKSTGDPYYPDGWSVKVTGPGAQTLKYPGANVPFGNQSTANTAQKYVNDMENAALKEDKAAYDHALNNLKAFQEITVSKYNDLSNKTYPYWNEIRRQVKEELGNEPDISSFRPPSGWTAAASAAYDKAKADYDKKYRELQDKKRDELLAKDPEAKRLFDEVGRLSYDRGALDNLVSDYGSSMWFDITYAVQKERREWEAAQKAREQLSNPDQPKTAITEPPSTSQPISVDTKPLTEAEKALQEQCSINDPYVLSTPGDTSKRCPDHLTTLGPAGVVGSGAPKTCGEIKDPKEAAAMGCVQSASQPASLAVVNRSTANQNTNNKLAACNRNPICEREVRERIEEEHSVSGQGMTNPTVPPMSNPTPMTNPYYPGSPMPGGPGIP